MKRVGTSTRGVARLGVVVPESNTNLEPDVAMLAPEGVSAHFARAGGYDVDAIPDEHQMRRYSETPAGGVIESLRSCRPDIILYGCTSATLAQGPEFDAAFRRDLERLAGVPAVTAAAALVEALGDLGVKRFAFCSPYVSTLNDLAIGFIQAHGFRCAGRADAPRPLGNEAVAAVLPGEVAAMAERADAAGAEAIVVSCTDFRAAEAVVTIERRLRKPVVTSNQALVYTALRRLGISFETSILRGHLLAGSGARRPGTRLAAGR